MVLPIASLTGTIQLAYFGWFDFAGDPVRATTFPGGKTFAAGSTGDPDLDGHTFDYIPSALLEVGDVEHTAGGASPLVVSLSGLAGPNDDLLGLLAVRANWQGRVGRLWHALYSGSTITQIAGYYTGYMMSAPLAGDPINGSRVSLTLENYVALLSRARSRTYQDQAEHDAGDGSPARVRAAANGTLGTGIVGGGVSGGRGDGFTLRYALN